MKLMMSKDGRLVTENGDQIDGVHDVSYTMGDSGIGGEGVFAEINLRCDKMAIYEDDVKPLKEDLSPKKNDEVTLKLISDGTSNPEGTKLIDVNTGRALNGVKSVHYSVDADGDDGVILVEFNRMAIEAGFVHEAIAFDYEEALALDRKERSILNRIRKMFKKLW